ncbi:hypothetical protein P12x_000929 [Tundrisphaera lichenicola]|uniref:hypothetical protein n=1 Tax=Tundrisphaera lichenicola TaxID=2029860 RepID=UPI003EB8B8CA
MMGNRWMTFAIGCGLAMTLARPSAAQGLYPPAPGDEQERLSRRMAEATRALAEDLAAHANQVPNGGYLARDARELERATADWYGSVREPGNPYRVRQSYSDIDAAWHRLRGQIGDPRSVSPGMINEVAKLDQVDDQMHRALHLNGYPPNFQVENPQPNGPDEVIRLAYALAQRAEALAATVQVEYAREPRGPALTNDAAVVARMADAFYDGLRNPAIGQQGDFAQQAFYQIIQKSNGLGIALDARPMSPRMASTWKSYTSVHNHLRAKLGLTNALAPGDKQPQYPQYPGVGEFNFDQRGLPYADPYQAPIGQWADQLDRQVDELVANFAPTVRVVPEGREMFEEMNRLRDDVHRFREMAARGGDPSRLAYDFRAVDASSHRLSRHFDRIARGRTGPNIQRVQEIAQTCEQIHRALGMPGFPPSFGPYDNPR